VGYGGPLSYPIIRQLVDPAGSAARCAAVGPMDMNVDPREAQLALDGMEPEALIIHTRKDQTDSLALYDALAPYLPVKRSFVMPKDSPETLVWFQFGKDVSGSNETAQTLTDQLLHLCLQLLRIARKPDHW